MEAGLVAELIARLGELFTRSYSGPAQYVFGAQPFQEPGDEDLLERLGGVREQERRQASTLAKLLQLNDLVPEAGVFPYWFRDLNYLTLPYMGGFVVEALEDDLRLYDAALEAAPATLRLVRVTLETLRAEKAASLGALRPHVAKAQADEARRYEAALAERAARTGRSRPGQAGISAPAVGLLDPEEPGIPAKERAKRQVLRRRAQQGAPAAAAPSAPGPSLLDPDEPGISAKEKAKRQVLRQRARKRLENGEP